MLEKSRTFFMLGPVGPGAAASVRMHVLSMRQWMFDGQGAEGPARSLPEPWASAVARLDRHEREETVYWTAHEAAQVRALRQAVGISRWLHVEAPPDRLERPLTKLFGIATDTGFEPVGEALSGTFSNHPFHSKLDDHYRFEVERWVGPLAEALRLRESKWRGQDAPGTSESWYLRATGSREWTKASALDCAGWQRVEHLHG